MLKNLSLCWKFLVMSGVILAIVFCSGTVKYLCINTNDMSVLEASETEHQPIVQDLKAILKANPQVKQALENSLKIANRAVAPNLESYYDFLDGMVTLIPTNRNIYPVLMEFYYLVSKPDENLRKFGVFQQWMVGFAQSWGTYLDTPESAKDLDTFYTDPRFHINDYIRGTSGWLTFNQFFYRNVKPGKRPIDKPCNDNVIVSPADAVYARQWKISKNSTIKVKGIEFKIQELLNESAKYKDSFEGGTFIHSFLSTNDYHRLHTPVGGVVKESLVIPGNVVLNVVKKADGSLDVEDGTGGTGYQFTQVRGLIIIETENIGLVAVLPIGMAQVSSVNMTAEVGVTLQKGEEFSYFAFGGSDIIVLFQKGKVKITAKKMVHYNQGEQIAKVKK